MSPLKPRRSRENAVLEARHSPSADSPSQASNVLAGTVISRTTGLTRTTLRIRIGDQTDLRVRWPASNPSYDAVEIGDRVSVTIPEEAVRLEAGGFRRSKQRWNRWVGRIVLVQQNADGPVTTVKIHRDSITVKSRLAVVGVESPWKAWDTVNIVVDPQQIRLTPARHSSTYETPAFSSISPVSHPATVWLRASIRSVRWSPAGYDVALNVGGVHLSTIVEGDPDTLSAWRIGASVEINISHYDAWVRLHPESPLLRCNVVFGSDPGGLQPSQTR